MRLHLWRRYSTFGRAVTYLKSTSEQLTGHTDVLQAQQQVKTKKEDLRQFRQELTHAIASYEEVQKKLKSLYARKTQVYQDQKRDIGILQTINNEEESLLIQEQTLHANVENCTTKERECFESLSDWIQISHEKERAQSERLKYYSRLGSILGAVFGFLGSHFFLRREVKRNHHRLLEKLAIIEGLLDTETVSTVDQSRETFQQAVQKELQATQEVLKILKGEVSECSQKLNELVTSQEKLSRSIALGNRAKETEIDVEGLVVKPVSLKDTHFMIGTVFYSLALAVCGVL